ncbi:DUF4422 domain-containing protein [Xylanibacter muris]|uniref:DUF4422 domain-containing protein n=1 Tax=Xylanibacter muris TaxID=2736290 RepID=A0ABX2AT21_9BACT|nr:DUF4422 domain-containing protein [Xylanibacter muris]NPD93101.1 DUF4422 domain-containing protein [Xylanibacter muris]
MEEKELTFWITYHEDKQIEIYGLKESDIFKLFRGNSKDVDGDNINYLNKFYSEIGTFYYVWKNNLKSRIIGFGHYRRLFPQIYDVEEGQCQVLSINYNNSVFNHYKLSHNYQDIYDVIDILNEKYGKDNKYSKYLLEGNVFIPFCCFIMNYTDFEKLCNWLFPIIFAWDKKNGLEMIPDKYLEKAKRDFRYDNVDYQCRAVAFLAERLISCYIVNEMNPFCISTL